MGLVSTGLLTAPESRLLQVELQTKGGRKLLDDFECSQDRLWIANEDSIVQVPDIDEAASNGSFPAAARFTNEVKAFKVLSA